MLNSQRSGTRVVKTTAKASTYMYKLEVQLQQLKLPAEGTCVELERRSQTTARTLRSGDRQQGSGRDSLQCYCGASPQSSVPRFHFRGSEPETVKEHFIPQITYLQA